MWNEPAGVIKLYDLMWTVRFRICAYMRQDIQPEDIHSNVNPKNNYIRIEDYCEANISFVDGLGCNSGYFKLENLYQGSTTAAHEYGHTLGLEHPEDLDLRGKGVPGIMYPRGTLVDPQYQYESDKPAGTKGGTMHPMFRKVQEADIASLRLHKISFTNGKGVLGEFTNIWHPDHTGTPPGMFVHP